MKFSLAFASLAAMVGFAGVCTALPSPISLQANFADMLSKRQSPECSSFGECLELVSDSSDLLKTNAQEILTLDFSTGTPDVEPIAIHAVSGILDGLSININLTVYQINSNALVLTIGDVDAIDTKLESLLLNLDVALGVYIKIQGVLSALNLVNEVILLLDNISYSLNGLLAAVASSISSDPNDTATIEPSVTNIKTAITSAEALLLGTSTSTS